ncbi:MAG: hypothetical protein HY360_20505 [Verrucomicrobia bacterium]|nr:hypothetical protein [Verrucomicrobiota bacterium]
MTTTVHCLGAVVVDALCGPLDRYPGAGVRKQLAAVLAQKVAQGQCSRKDAIAIARAILFESPQQLLNMKPATP